MSDTLSLHTKAALNTVKQDLADHFNPKKGPGGWPISVRVLSSIASRQALGFDMFARILVMAREMGYTVYEAEGDFLIAKASNAAPKKSPKKKKTRKK